MGLISFGRKQKLFSAVESNDMPTVKRLVEKDLSLVKSTNKDGWTPLHIAAREGNAGIARYLIDKRADIDAKNSTGGRPLHIAAWNAGFEVVTLLIQCGADVNARGSGGRTPLQEAIIAPQVILQLGRGYGCDEHDYKMVADLLRKHGATG